MLLIPGGKAIAIDASDSKRQELAASHPATPQKLHMASKKAMFALLACRRRMRKTEPESAEDNGGLAQPHIRGEATIENPMSDANSM